MLCGATVGFIGIVKLADVSFAYHVPGMSCGSLNTNGAFPQYAIHRLFTVSKIGPMS